MLRHCIAFRNLTPCVLPSSRMAGRSRAVPSSNWRGRAILAVPSLTISSRHVSGVSRALTRSSPCSVYGRGLPRLTLKNSSELVRYFRAAGSGTVETPLFQVLPDEGQRLVVGCLKEF